jgi:hypothetical protein
MTVRPAVAEGEGGACRAIAEGEGGPIDPEATMNTAQIILMSLP